MEDENKKKQKSNPADEQMKTDMGTGLYDLANAIGGTGQHVIGSDNPGDDEDYNKARFNERLDISGSRNEKTDE